MSGRVAARAAALVLAGACAAPAAAPTVAPTIAAASPSRATATATPMFTLAATGSPASTPPATPTPTPTPTVPYVSRDLGYSFDLPAPWRYTECLSTGLNLPGVIGYERFIPVGPYDERSGGIGFFPHDQVTVMVLPNPDRLSPRQYEAARLGSGAVREDVTLAGRPALRGVLTALRNAVEYHVADGDRMFQIEHAKGDASPTDTTAAQRAAIVASLRFLTADELRSARASPTPAPSAPRTPEQLADALADAFAKKDAARLASLTASCLTTGLYRSDAARIVRERYIDDLRARFATGLEVTIRARPIRSSEFAGHLEVESTWRPAGQPAYEVDLRFGAVGATWYWVATISYRGPRPSPRP